MALLCCGNKSGPAQASRMSFLISVSPRFLNHKVLYLQRYCYFLNQIFFQVNDRTGSSRNVNTWSVKRYIQHLQTTLYVKYQLEITALITKLWLQTIFFLILRTQNFWKLCVPFMSGNNFSWQISRRNSFSG